MKRRITQYFLLSFGLLILALAVSFTYARSLPEESTKVSLYLTVAAEPLPEETSSYELQRAAEHFSDLLLGWSVAPGFNYGSEASFTGRRQEKQNLLFMIETNEIQPAEQLLETLTEKVSAYNEAAQSSYLLTNVTISSISEPTEPLRVVGGAALLSLVASFVLIFAHDSFLRYRR